MHAEIAIAVFVLNLSDIIFLRTAPHTVLCSPCWVRWPLCCLVKVTVIFAVSGSNSAVSVSARLVLTCFVCCNCWGISVVTRDNYHCCIFAGKLALNSLVPWMFVIHHDRLSARTTILHNALASVIWPSATLIIVDRFSQLSLRSFERTRVEWTLVQVYRTGLLYWE